MKNSVQVLFFLFVTFTSFAASAQSWVNQSDMKLKRSEAAAVDYKGELWVFNGFSQGLFVGTSIEKYNPSSKQWTLVGKTSVAKGTGVTHSSAILVGDEAWIIGGRIGAHPGKVTNNVWIYNFNSKSFREGPKLPKPMAGGGAALVNNKIYSFGGIDSQAKCDVNFNYVYNLGNPSAGWKNITGSAGMPSARNHFSTVVVDDIIYAIGGQHGHDGCPSKKGGNVDLVHSFNPANNKWSSLAKLPAIESHNEPSTFVHNGFIYTVGGATAGNKVLRYDPALNKWENIINLPERLLAPVARIYDGRLVVGGGGAPITAKSHTKVRSVGLAKFNDKAKNYNSSNSHSNASNNLVDTTNTSNADNTSNGPGATETSDASDSLVEVQGDSNFVFTAVNNMVVIEAEKYQAKTKSGLHEWLGTNLANASGNSALVSMPNAGALRSGVEDSPRLSYKVSFSEAGSYSVWVRGRGDQHSNGMGSNDSIHAGLNNALSKTADKIDGFPVGWNWSNSTRDGAPATINIPSAGVHTFNLWMREDGFAVDKIILAKNAAYKPSGLGESSTQVSNDAEVVVNIAPSVLAGSNGTMMEGDSFKLTGSVSDDTTSVAALKVLWKKISGPGAVSFADATQASTSVTVTTPGNYVLELSASDGALSSASTVTLSVSAKVVETETETSVDEGSNESTEPNTSTSTETNTDINVSSGPDVIAIEAEAYFTHKAMASHQWVKAELPGASGNASMITTPNVGSLKTDSANSPMMGYLISFEQAGTYTLWIRGWGLEGEGQNDSIHAGLNGSLSSTADKIDGFPAGGWHWSKSTRDGVDATITVPSSGIHSVNLWMREDGFAIDKFILTKNTSYVPTGMGQVNVATTVSVTSDSENSSNGDAVAAEISNAEAQSDTANTVSTSNEDTYNVVANDEATTTVVNLANADKLWQLVQTANGSASMQRHAAGAVTANNKLYVLGGRRMGLMQSYDDKSEKWSSHGFTPELMHHFQPVVLGGKIYVIGAMTDNNYPAEKALEHVYIYDVVNSSWTKGAAIPQDRLRSSMGAAVHNGKIYLIGGNTQGHSGPAVKWFDEFDPATNQWRVMPDAPHARDHANAAVVGGKLVFAAGRRSAFPNVTGDMEAATNVFNFATGQWEYFADNIPNKRSAAMAVAIGDEVLVIGGESTAQYSSMSNVEALNVNTGKWRTLQPLMEGRHSGVASVLNGKIHVLAGNITRGGASETTSHETLEFDIKGQ